MARKVCGEEKLSRQVLAERKFGVEEKFEWEEKFSEEILAKRKVSAENN